MTRISVAFLTLLLLLPLAGASARDDAQAYAPPFGPEDIERALSGAAWLMDQAEVGAAMSPLAADASAFGLANWLAAKAGLFSRDGRMRFDAALEGLGYPADGTSYFTWRGVLERMLIAHDARGRGSTASLEEIEREIQTIPTAAGDEALAVKFDDLVYQMRLVTVPAADLSAIATFEAGIGALLAAARAGGP